MLPPQQNVSSWRKLHWAETRITVHWPQRQELLCSSRLARLELTLWLGFPDHSYVKLFQSCMYLLQDTQNASPEAWQSLNCELKIWNDVNWLRLFVHLFILKRTSTSSWSVHEVHTQNTEHPSQNVTLRWRTFFDFVQKLKYFPLVSIPGTRVHVLLGLGLMGWWFFYCLEVTNASQPIWVVSQLQTSNVQWNVSILATQNKIHVSGVSEYDAHNHSETNRGRNPPTLSTTVNPHLSEML